MMNINENESMNDKTYLYNNSCIAISYQGSLRKAIIFQISPAK